MGRDVVERVREEEEEEGGRVADGRGDSHQDHRSSNNQALN